MDRDILKLVRALLALTIVVLAGCNTAAPPPAAEQPKADLTAADWYAPTIAQLVSLNREAEDLIAHARFDDASAAITHGQALQTKLLEASHPTLAAMEAASDLDDLYGRMLLHNKQYGYARGVFQKNVVRWKHWKPETPDTERRLKSAADSVAECDRRMME